MDDRCFDSPTQPKRPRVFFTEDQKDSLRQAYAQDPYPNQSTIESLAKGLGVGVKTVINWFHNHRMRAKQQHHSGGGNGSDPTIKSEPDESSNQSDMSSISGSDSINNNTISSSNNNININNTTNNNGLNPTALMMMGGGQFLQAGGNPTDLHLNQWMFPQFETMGALMMHHKLSSSALNDDNDNDEDNKENQRDASLENEDEMDEPDGMDTSTTSNNNNNNNKDNSDDQLAEPSSEPNGDCPSNTSAASVDSKTSLGHPPPPPPPSSSSSSLPPPTSFTTDSSLSAPSSSLSSSAPSQTPPIGSSCSSISSSAVNKRKRSNPQRVYEGAQLDRTSLADRVMASAYTPGMTKGNAPTISEKSAEQLVNGLADGGQHSPASSATEVDSGGVDESSHAKVSRIRKIEKIQNAIKSPIEMWDEEEAGKGARVGGSSSIEKMQRHIETNSTDEEWEDFWLQPTDLVQ